MTVLRNNFDGGTAGVTITVANSAPGGDPFDSVSSTGTGAVVRFVSATDRPTAEYVMETSTGATATTPSVVWSTSMGAQGTIYTRWYAKFTVIPTSGNNDNVMFMVWSGATHCCSIWMTNLDHTLDSAVMGQVTILTSPGSTSLPMTTVIAAGLWHRFEFKATMSASTGVGELRLYAYPDTDSDTPTETLSVTGQNFGAASANSFRLGCANPLSSQTPTIHSGWELNNTGWPGALPFRPGKGVPGILSTPVAVHTDAW